MPQQEESMRVVVRMRPPSEQDGDSSNKPTIDSVGRKISVLRDRKGTAEFSFSSVLGEESKQEDLYDVCRDSVSYVMDGINCCILAYGQTGSGKTYSMLGKGWEDPNFVVSGDSDQLQPPGIFNDDEYGIIPRSISEIFDKIEAAQQTQESFDFLINCQFLQLYNEKIYDLLQDRKRENPLQLRDAERGSGSSVYVQGLSEYRVRSADDVLGLLGKGLRNRAIRSTELNNESSRSHTILQLFVQLQGVDGSGLATLKRSVFSLVDLAGSEKWRPALSQSQGIAGGLVTAQQAAAEQQLREMTNINTSLHVLGNCVSALIEPGRKHIPFRDSLLTRLLQDSLGGGRSTLIATVRADDSMIDETYSTLQFASRASKIKTVLRPSSKVVLSNSEGGNGLTLEKARREIALLRSQVHSLQLEVTASRALVRPESYSHRAHPEGEGPVEDVRAECPTCETLRAALVQSQQHIRELQALVAAEIDAETGSAGEDGSGSDEEHGRREGALRGDSSAPDFMEDVRVSVPRTKSPAPQQSFAKKKKATNRGLSRKGEESIQTRTQASKQKVPKRAQQMEKNSHNSSAFQQQRRALAEKNQVKKKKASRALSASQAVPDHVSDRKVSPLPQLKSNSAGSRHVLAPRSDKDSTGRKKQSRAVEESGIVGGEKGRISDILSMSRAAAAAVDNSFSYHQHDSTPLNSVDNRESLPSLSRSGELESVAAFSRSHVQEQSRQKYQDKEGDAPKEGKCEDADRLVGKNGGGYFQSHEYTSNSDYSFKNELSYSLRSGIGSQSIESHLPPDASSPRHITSAASNVIYTEAPFSLASHQEKRSQPPIMADPSSPSVSLRSESSVVTSMTEVPSGACKKHGLMACVLCAMFGGPVAAPSLPVSKSHHNSEIATSSSSAVENAHADLAPYKSIMSSGKELAAASSVSSSGPKSCVSRQSGLCAAHQVMDCLLCTINSTDRNNYYSKSPVVRNVMYTAPMLGEASVGSSLSSLSSADSGFGLGTTNPPFCKEQETKADYYRENPGERKPQHRTETTVKSVSHEVPSSGAGYQSPVSEASKVYHAIGDADCHSIGQFEPRNVKEAVGYGKSPSERSSSGKLRIGSGIVYEDEADMTDGVGTGQQQYESMGSVGRRDHRRVPFNNDKYRSVQHIRQNEHENRVDDNLHEHIEVEQSGYKVERNKLKQHHQHVTGGPTRSKKMTRRLPNGAVVAVKKKYSP